MDINQFTLNAQNALQAAQSLASEYGQQQVDNEHLFSPFCGRKTAWFQPF